MMIGMAELMEAVGDMIEDESIRVPTAVQMAFDKLDAIVIEVIGKQSEKPEEDTHCHCGQTLDTVGRCVYHGLPKEIENADEQ